MGKETKVVEAHGMRITSMQHDGVVATGGAMSMSEAEAGTTDAATQACGFTVEVVGKRCRVTDAQLVD